MSEQVLFLVLFIIPGLVATWAAEMASAGSRRQRPETIVIAAMLLASTPISLLTWVALRLTYGVWGIRQITVHLSEPGFFAAYVGISLVLALFLGSTWPLASGKVLGLINWFRGKKDLADRDPANDVWENFVAGRNKMPVEIIMPSGERCMGWVDHFSMPENPDRELLLGDIDIFESPDYKKYFTVVRRIYCSLDSGVVIKEYDDTAWEEFVRSTHQSSTSSAAGSVTGSSRDAK